MYLLALRNPWGTFEFGGDWSDNSSKWTSHPEVKAAVLATGLFREGRDIKAPAFNDTSFHRDGSDGSFFMCLDDFKKWFSCVHAVRGRSRWTSPYRPMLLLPPAARACQPSVQPSCVQVGPLNECFGMPNFAPCLNFGARTNPAA